MIAPAAHRPMAGGFARRGACPALSAPMKTGDGLLARLNPVAGGLTPAQLGGLCEAAQAHGNGVVEVTARGSIQVRGLTESSAVLFAQAIDRLGISARTGVPVQTGALAGLDPNEIADPTTLAEMIRAGTAKAGLEARLGPKISVVIDGGGRTALIEVAADVRLTAIHVEGLPHWRVAIAGDAATARTLGIAHGDTEASEAALALLSEIAAMGREARARDLSEAQLLRVSNRLSGSHPAMPPSGHAAGSLVGTTRLRDDRLAFGVALPFGHTKAKLLKALAEAAQTLGIDDIRPAPGRTLVALCGTAIDAETLKNQAETLGFVTSPDDVRQAISACPGAPECASGHLPARLVAAEIANEYSSLLDGSIHLHVSGCAKGCAHPGKADLTVVGCAGGAGLVVNGTARDEPLGFVDNVGARGGLAAVAALVSAGRHTEEATAQAIDRIGFSALAEAFGQSGK
ncbi:precorrin-3B synthase [Mesorhizobium sp. KR9-304]|uniref:precorrin-3B synthase n=1 Tax=Mesorhizobium sp. KR9-304 TaxID=3156614 RepID=UPI0032B3E9FF